MTTTEPVADAALPDGEVWLEVEFPESGGPPLDPLGWRKDLARIRRESAPSMLPTRYLGMNRQTRKRVKLRNRGMRAQPLYESWSHDGRRVVVRRAIVVGVSVPGLGDDWTVAVGPNRRLVKL